MEKQIKKVLGPYLFGKNKDRRHVVIFYDDGSRKCTSYARHLMENKIGRSLGEFEHVDHRDENPLNDDLENLQIMTPSENIKKSIKDAEKIPFTCLECGFQGVKVASKVRHNQEKQGKKGPFCDKVCAGKYGWRNQDQKPMPSKTALHGSDSMYNYQGCRCDICRQGKRDRMRKWREEKKIRDLIPTAEEKVSKTF